MAKFITLTVFVTADRECPWTSESGSEHCLIWDCDNNDAAESASWLASSDALAEEGELGLNE